MAVDRYTARHARDLARVSRQVARLSSPQLSDSSIEDGSVDEYDETGTLVGVVGKQHDGTHVAASVGGPVPPAPVAPSLSGGPTGVTVEWSGAWSGGAVAPMDLARIDVVVLDDPAADPLTSQPVASIVSQGWGGASANKAEGTYWAVLVARSFSGKFAVSAPSEAAVVSLPSPDPSDGLPPDSSPVPELIGAMGTVVVRLPEVAGTTDPISVRLHAALEPGVVVDELSREGVVPNGGGAILGAIGGVRLAAGDTVYVRTQAFDVDGAADPSAEVSATVLAVDFDEVSQDIKDAIAAADGKASDAQTDASSAIQDALEAYNLAQAAETPSGAQAKAEAAETAAALDASAKVNEVNLRGTNLVLNGSGELGNNKYFSTMTYAPSDAPPGGVASFERGKATIITEQLITVDPTKTYRVDIAVRQVNKAEVPTSRFYLAVNYVDAYGNSFAGNTGTQYLAGTLTELAVALNPGDTTVTLADGTGWIDNAADLYKTLIFWDYIDPGGRIWPPETYSRNSYFRKQWTRSGNVLTLAEPYSGAAHPAGTKLSQSTQGGGYAYFFINGLAPGEWTTYSTEIRGIKNDGGPITSPGGVPHGATAVQFAILSDYNNVGGIYRFSGFSISEGAAARDTALAAQTAATTADAKAVTADGKAVAAQATANTKARTFAQTSAPSATAVGDLWVDTDDQNKLYRATAIGSGGWALVRDGLLAVQSSQISDALTEATAALTAAQAAQATADGAITTHYQPDPPAGMTDDNLGDLWFDTDTNQASRWAGASNGGWLLIQDNSIADALAAAQSAQTTADGKITAFYQPSQPTTGMEEGDLWYDTDDKNKPYFYDSATWVPVRDGTIADAQSTATTAGNLAASKGKVIIQSAAPAAADRLPQNLWIDTTPIGSPAAPGNVPKRWTSGTTWVAVTDKAVVDAAAAAAAAKAAADDAMDTATTALDSANGKNSRRTGPAIADGSFPTTPAGTVAGDTYWGRTDGVIVQQWAYDGATWVSEQVDVAVVAGLDAAYINGVIIEGDTFLGKLGAFEKVQAEDVAADVMITNDFFARDGIQVGDSDGANLRINSSEGLVGTNDDGEVSTRIDHTTGLLSALGASIRGFFEAGSLTVRNALTIMGLENFISAGARVRVASGVSSPQTAPNAERYWPGVDTVFAGDFSSLSRGMVLNGAGDRWVVPSSFFGGYINTMNLDGSTDFSAQRPIAEAQPDGGITRIGSNYYALCAAFVEYGHPRFGKWFVKRFNSSFVETGEWEWPTSAKTTHRPTIGTDGTNLLIAWHNTFGELAVRTFTPGGSIVSTITLDAAPTDLSSVYPVTITGQNRIIVTRRRDMYALNPATGVRDTTRERMLAGSSALAGMGFDGTRFRHLDSAGQMFTYSTLAVDTPRSAQYAWYRPGGPNETDRGPARTFTQVAGSYMRIATDTPYVAGPTYPDSVRIWIDGQRQPDLAVGVTTASYEIPATGTTTKAPSFASAGISAGVFESEQPNGWSLSGDGRAKVRAPQADNEAVNLATLTGFSNVQRTELGTRANLSSTTNQTLAGLTAAFNSPGPTAQYEVTIYGDVRAENATNIIEVLANGVPRDTQMITGAGTSALRVPVSKSWLIDGIPTGSLSITARTRNSGSSGSTNVYETHTVMFARRVA